jgi:predicted nucleic-acid-binding protein
MMASQQKRIFCDTSVLMRYFVGDDAARGFAAAALIESSALLFVSTGVLIELIHGLRTEIGISIPSSPTG